MSSAHSRSSDRPTADTFADALARAVAGVRDAVVTVEAANPVILIDGRSGAGKSSLAREIVASWPLAGRVQLVALDSLYPGWDGLEEGAETARRLILAPHARGAIGVWQRFDWESGIFAEAHAVDPALPLIVEGAGILTPDSSPLADVCVWLESPAHSRRRRALARDGDGFRPHWERWATQEEDHLRRNHPTDLATIRVTLP